MSYHSPISKSNFIAGLAINMDDFISKLDEYKISHSLSEVIQRSLDKCSLTSGKQHFLLPSSIEDRATCIYRRKKTACWSAVCVPRSSSPTLHKVLVNLQHKHCQNYLYIKIYSSRCRKFRHAGSIRKQEKNKKKEEAQAGSCTVTITLLTIVIRINSLCAVSYIADDNVYIGSGNVDEVQGGPFGELMMKDIAFVIIMYFCLWKRRVKCWMSLICQMNLKNFLKNSSSRYRKLGHTRSTTKWKEETKAQEQEEA